MSPRPRARLCPAGIEQLPGGQLDADRVAVAAHVDARLRQGRQRLQKAVVGGDGHARLSGAARALRACDFCSLLRCSVCESANCVVSVRS